MKWDPPSVQGLSTLQVGVQEGCPGNIGCDGTAFLFEDLVPGASDFFDVSLCRPPANKFNCDGEQLFPYSRLSPEAGTHTWVLEVRYTGGLEIRFDWDEDDLPQDGELKVWIVDTNSRIQVNNPPPNVSPHIMNIESNVQTKAFLICSQANENVQTPCPNLLP